MHHKMSEETREKIRTMVARGIPYSAIADTLGCSKGQVGRVVHPQPKKGPGRDGIAWTEEECARAVAMRNQGMSIGKIADRLGRSFGSAQSQLMYRHEDGTRVATHNPGPAPSIPESVLADRDRRMAMYPRDLTAALMGDPPVGYSALERRVA